tara:strand:- start:178 stop:363 length:186 start_codon:yes stop_codon:yes gene_type:complete
MTHHLVDPTVDQLKVITDRLILENIPYKISVNSVGLILSVETDDIELLAYCESNNPNLVPV